MDIIRIEGMEFSACHGVLPEEKKRDQVFIVDVSLYLDLTEASINDDLESTVNYAEIYEIVKLRMYSETYNLIERLCYLISEDILKYSGLIDRVRVVVHKPNAPIQGVFEDISVSMERGRDVPLLS